MLMGVNQRCASSRVYPYFPTPCSGPSHSSRTEWRQGISTVKVKSVVICVASGPAAVFRLSCTPPSVSTGKTLCLAAARASPGFSPPLQQDLSWILRGRRGETRPPLDVSPSLRPAAYQCGRQGASVAHPGRSNLRAVRGAPIP